MKVTKEFIRPDSGKPASVALGLFDGIHIGHTKVLQQALKNRELAPCVFTYTISSFVPQIKKNYLALMPDEQKCAILERMGFEQVVMPDFSSFKDMEPEEFVEKMLIQGMGAKELSCGYDFTFGKGGAGTTETLCRVAERHGVKVNVVEPVTLDGEPVSSTRIRQAILEGKMGRGQPHAGPPLLPAAEGGARATALGRLLDFPTINQSFPQHHIVPRYGVYSTVVNVAGKLYGGVTNVGLSRRSARTARCRRPTSWTIPAIFTGRRWRLLLPLCPPGAEIWLDRRTQGADCPGQRGRGAGGCAKH